MNTLRLTTTPPSRLRALSACALGAALTLASGCGEETGSGNDGSDTTSGTSADSSSGTSADESGGSPWADEAALAVSDLATRYDADLDSLIFELTVEGDAASVAPVAIGQVDGAPVLGYVFLTTLAPQDVGFGGVEGTVALAITSHPDFDDTPLWDEDGNEAYDDDGVVYHAHWVVLVEDERAAAGLAVAQSIDGAGLPPTAPMPMYLDSPGFTVVEDGSQLRVLVPLDRVRRRTDFSVGLVTASMQVDASGDAPVLLVQELVSALDDGALNTTIDSADLAPASAWPEPQDDELGLTLQAAEGRYDASVDTFVMTMNVRTAVATNVPSPNGELDGAPVLGYVFPTTIPPAEVGFTNVDGLLALAVTSHPDFDDTPLWDESGDADFANDGAVYHVHWAVLVDDEDSTGGLSVPGAVAAELPPTAPMPMALDSPGYHAFARGDALHVLIPGWHLGGVEQFSFDAVTARMHVDASGPGPVLRVDEVVDVLSGDLSLPMSVSRE